MSEIGLAFVIAGWVIQLLHKGNKILPGFVAAYAIGVLILTIDAYLSNLKLISLLNLIVVVISGLVFVKAKQKK